MNNDLLKWGVLGVGAWLLLGGARPTGASGGNTGAARPLSVPAQPALPGMTIFVGQQPTMPQTSIVTDAGLAAASGDEDIGIAPVPGIAAPISPIFRVEGTREGGFTLSGPFQVEGDTRIRVEAFGGVGTFATTPDVLAQELINQGPVIADPNPAPSIFLFQRENVDLDIGI